MSNKVEKHRGVPRLRFPEFREAGVWEEKLLGSSIEEFRGKSAVQDEFEVLTSARSGLVRQRDYYDNDRIAGRDNVGFNIVPPNYVTYRSRSDDRRFYFNENNLGVTGIVSVYYPVFRLLEGSNKFFIELLARYSRIVGKHCVGTSQTVLSLNGLKRIKLPIPKEPEQEKVADCLASLDELITLEGEKLDALKTHKKGLIQQLFPAEGETVPNLRFRKFRDAGEWKIDSIGNIFETTSGGTPSRSEESYWGGNIPWITTSLVNFGVITGADEFITKDGLNNSSAKLFPEGTTLIAMYGQGITRGKVAFLGIEAATNQACAAILPRNDIEPYFVFQNLAGRYEEMRELSNRGGQENLSQGLIKGLVFAYPSDVEEQKYIISCLSSLDDVITAQTDKLNALKTHKKGLMQQLFPVLDEVSA